MASEEESSRKKRGAENQLTQHNWEADDDPIDPQVSVCPCRPLAGGYALCAAARKWCRIASIDDRLVSVS